MATKDWKKISKNHWKHDKYHGKRISISELENDFYKYVLYIQSSQNTFNHKYFKTKTQALIFAKAYMRKH